MIEIPESLTIARQARLRLSGLTVEEVIPPTSPHKFTWYNGDPADYHQLLEGRKILSASGFGAFVELEMENGAHLLVSDGVNMRHYTQGEELPVKHQLAITLNDGSSLIFTVAMYGGIYAHSGSFDNPYYVGARAKFQPLDEAFGRDYFLSLARELKRDMSVKAFLATEQRIPGLGNGVLQDILFNAGVSPKRKMSSVDGKDMENLLEAMKSTLGAMLENGGRDTEKDLFGNKGRYRTLMSKNTYKNPCPVCGGAILKEAYLGGTIYYCPACQ